MDNVGIVKRRLSLCGWLCGICLVSASALAHQSSTAYMQLQPIASQWQVTYSIAVRDTALLVPMDANHDLRISWGELKSQQAKLNQLIQTNLRFSVGQQPCQLVPVAPTASDAAALMLDDIAGVKYAVITMQAVCAAGAGLATTLDYAMLKNIDDEHRLIISMSPQVTPTAGSAGVNTTATASRSWLIAPGRTQLQPAADTAVGNTLFANYPYLIQTVSSYVQQGLAHILAGYDHLLFLLCLLLPAVLRRSGNRWQPAEHPAAVIRSTVVLVTAFTLAHSVTLCLAALNVVTIGVRFTESMIALSIAVVALNNLKPVFNGHMWKITFGFGLIHGFGFASALANLPLDTSSRVLALLSFNIGLEIGQLGCVLVFLPLALYLRKRVFYQKIVFTGGSLVIMAIAMVLFVQRIFDL